MTIASEITRIKTAIADAYIACQDMGATMPAVLNSDNLEQCIASISGGQPVPTTKQRLVSVADNLDTNKLVLYTDDGINWNTSTMPNSRNWGNVFYGNGKFIVPCYNSDIYAYSTDGINWTEGTLPISNTWKYGVYGNGKYVLISDSNPAYVCYSADGINWSYQYLQIPIKGLLFDEDKFVICRGTYNTEYLCDIATSSDIINWTSISTQEFLSGLINGSVFFSYNNSYYAVSYAKSSSQPITNQYIYEVKKNDRSWYSVFQSTYNNILPVTSCVINGESKIFSGHKVSSLVQAAGYFNINSNDNAEFVGSSVPRLNYQGGANILNGKAIVIGYGSDQYIYSTDGTTWSTGTLPASSGWWGSCVGEVTV